MLPGQHFFYRGMENAEWHLQPSIFRVKLQTPTKQRLLEPSLIRDFMLQAPLRHGSFPESDDHAGWLCLMQHYGLPTRLLDWTSSPLMAAYFAVASGHHKDKDACIWCMVADDWNAMMTGQTGVRTLEDAEISDYLKGIFSQSSVYSIADAIQEMRSRIGKPTPDMIASLPPEVRANVPPDFIVEEPPEEGPHKVYAVMGKHFDMRLLMQQGCFTLHQSSVPMEELLTDALPRHSFQKWFIRAEHRGRIAWELRMLGLEGSSVFPDLDHLASELKRKYLEPVYVPNFSGGPPR